LSWSGNSGSSRSGDIRLVLVLPGGSVREERAHEDRVVAHVVANEDECLHGFPHVHAGVKPVVAPRDTVTLRLIRGNDDADVVHLGEQQIRRQLELDRVVVTVVLQETVHETYEI